MPLDTFGIAMCDHDLCEMKENCKRFQYNFLAEYDFSEIKKYWNCFIKKDIVKKEEQ